MFPRPLVQPRIGGRSRAHGDPQHAVKCDHRPKPTVEPKDIFVEVCLQVLRRHAVVPCAEVRTDAWIGYPPLAALGYSHEALAVCGDHAKADKHLPMIHIAFGNLDAWLLGTHHGVSPQHLQAYLNEYVFRFNRRFWPMVAFDSVLGIAVRAAAPTYAGLYEGAWEHPGVWQE